MLGDENLPLVRAARSAVYAARKAGQWAPKPCERCGSTKDVEGHHEDYAKPLEVVWLCRSHHRQRHIEINLAQYGKAKLNKEDRRAIRARLPQKWLTDQAAA